MLQERIEIVKKTKEEHPTWTKTEISRYTGIPRTSVREYIDRIEGKYVPRANQHRPKHKAPDTPEKDLAKIVSNNRYSALKEKYNTALHTIKALQESLETLISIKDSPKNIAIIPANEAKREVVPVIVASDWHLEEKVDLSVTNGVNQYNLDIAKKSVEQFFENAGILVNQCARDNTINTVVLAVLGDIINGVLRAEDLQGNQMTMIESVMLARQLLYSGIKHLLKATGKKIKVICCVGNHGRLTDKIHHSCQVRNSLEYLIYKTLERDYRDNPDVDFYVSESYYTIQNILGMKIRFHHGHTFKFHGGIGGLSVPVLRKISQLNLIEQADLDVCGHFHSMQIFPNCILNGSIVGTNGYSIAIGVPHERPQQAFFLVDSKYKRTVVAPIFIDRDLN